MTDTKELRALLAAATPGPWEVRLCEDAGHWGLHEWMEIHSPSGEIDVDETPDGEAFPNAALIVAAVNALPKLLDEVERSERRLADWKEALAERDALRVKVHAVEGQWASAACPCTCGGPGRHCQ